jgi:hypothetical protein
MELVRELYDVSIRFERTLQDLRVMSFHRRDRRMLVTARARHLPFGESLRRFGVLQMARSAGYIIPRVHIVRR